MRVVQRENRRGKSGCRAIRMSIKCEGNDGGLLILGDIGYIRHLQDHRTNSSLMAITRLMHRLTQPDLGSMIQTRTYVHDNFPTVALFPRPVSGTRDIKTRFAV